PGASPPVGARNAGAAANPSRSGDGPGGSDDGGAAEGGEAAPPTRGSDLLSRFLPAEAGSLGEAVDRFLAQLDDLGGALPGTDAGSDDQLDDLIARLNRGDFGAAERVLKAYEPQLRMAVSRQLNGSLRTKLDSMDIVQAVWADVLAGFRTSGWRFADRRQLKA